MRRGERFGCYIYIYKKNKTHIRRHIQNDVCCSLRCVAQATCSVMVPLPIHSNCTTYSLCRKVRNVKHLSAIGTQSASDRKEKNISQLWTNYESRESSNSNVQCGFYNTQIYAEYRSALRPCLGAAGLLHVL